MKKSSGHCLFVRYARVRVRREPALLFLALATLNGVAGAQAPGGDPLGPMTQFVCRIGTTLGGPLGLAVGFVVLMGGFASLAVGGRRALGTLAWGAAGVVGLVSGVAIFTALFGRAPGC